MGRDPITLLVWLIVALILLFVLLRIVGVAF